MTASVSTPDLDEPIEPQSTRLPVAITATAVVFGLLVGVFEITNTSIGWHIASGRWMVEHRAVLDHDPFSFTAGGVEWVDHEWLFQLTAAGLFEIGGAPALVGFRMVIATALALLLLRIGTASGLDPPAALVLASLCVWAARPRFFVRPELVTLLLVPLALWLFASRDGRRGWPLPLLAVIAVGANFHGGILVAPVLVSLWFAGEAAGWIVDRRVPRPALVSGLTGVAAAAAAPLLNPHGWRIWSVPFTLAEMVRMPHIPNPEWISPGPSEAPALFVALVLSAAVLATSSRSPQHWLAAAATAALALRHVRNLGLFFVVLPIWAAPALARLPVLRPPTPSAARDRRRRTVSIAAVAVIGVAALLRPWPAPGFSFADRWYPDRAWAFMESHGLLDGTVYNDVRFGGWILLNNPDRGVFLDDRNEIHEPLLREIWEIFGGSDVRAWEALLARYDVDTVLLRYHEPLRVTKPDGTGLGRRGFSQLWFPADRWAMVYWDDVAMVLVRRSSVDAAFLAEREYRLLHPDDLEHLGRRLDRNPSLRAGAAAELRRALADDPGCRRANELSALLD